MRFLVAVVLISGFSWECLAQPEPALSSDPYSPERYRLTLKVMPGVRSVAGGRPVAFSFLSGSWITPSSVWKVDAAINRQLSFRVDSDPLLISIPDSVGISNPEELAIRPDDIIINQPLQLGWEYHQQDWKVEATAGLFTLSTDRPVPDIVQLNSLYSIDWNPENQFSSWLTGSVAAGYRVGDWLLEGGLSSIRIPVSEPKEAWYRLKRRPDPLIRLSWASGVWWMGSAWENGLVGLSASRKLAVGWSESEPGEVTVDLRTDPYQDRWHRFRYEVKVPIASRSVLHARIIHANRQNAVPSAESIGSFLSRQAVLTEPLFDQWSVSIGFSLSLSGTPEPIPLALVNSHLYHNEFFSAKRGYYSVNPVGMIDLINTSETPTTFRLSISSHSDFMKYRSGWKTLDGFQSASIPLYVYLADSTGNQATLQDQLMVTVVTNDQEKLMASWPVAVHDRHLWDGQTWSLRDFTTTTDPVILEKTRQAYLMAVRQQTGEGMKQRLDQLATFLSIAGSWFTYMPDPTGPGVRDRIQYPVETLTNRAGDCEDLVVFTASVLMAAGYDCAVVDIRPTLPENLTVPTANPGAVGHVMLLVDTGIPAELMTDTGLSELQAVTRQNNLGDYTLWIPIETTDLPKGFESAFRSGVSQYYEEIILKNGVEKGHVQIYDF